jgi:hypothetical protein
MQGFKRLVLAASVAGVCFAAAASTAEAQIGVAIGVEPACPYGYYDVAPYACAPYGYYGSEWFSGGVFIGAGPWFHGREHFRGHVDNHFDIHRGYRGPIPNRGDNADPSRRFDQIEHFRGNEMRDGHGHVGGGRR